MECHLESRGAQQQPGAPFFRRESIKEKAPRGAGLEGPSKKYGKELPINPARSPAHDNSGPCPPKCGGSIPEQMEESEYRIQIRQYPRAGGATWRWWIFDRSGGTHLDTGVVADGDRAAVERAATCAIELLKQQKREWSPEQPPIAPRTTQL
jgi:hypothetical protein